MSDSVLSFILVGNPSSAIAAMEKVAAAAEGVGEKSALASKKSATAASKASDVFTKIGKASAVAIAAFAVYGVDQASKFQKLTNVYVTAAGEQQKNLKTVQAGVLKIAENTGTAWQDVAAATYTAEKAGYRAGDAYKVVEAAAQGAKEENANLATVTNAVTSIMASYHLKASDAVMVTDQLKAAAGESKVSFEDFSGALSTVLPIASAARISFAQVAGAFATLTQHGTSADEATQELAATIRALQAPNPVAQKTMAQLGISSNDVSENLGKRGLAGTLDYLTQTVLTKMGPAGTVLLNTFNQSKQASADAATELAALSPAGQKLATAFENGSIGLQAYKTQAKALGGEQGALALQFLTTYTNAKGFQSTLQQGLSQNKTYEATIKAITGGAIGLNTTLQLTGESSKATAERIKTIADAAKDAGTNVQGWASTQKLFSTQMDEFRQRVEVTAIKVGMVLIPALSKMLGVLTQHPIVLELAVAAIGAFAAAWTAVKIGNTISALVRMATAIRGVGAASAAAGAETRAAALGSAATADVTAGGTMVATAESGSLEAGAAAGAASRGSKVLGAVTKVVIPVAVTYAVLKTTGLWTSVNDALHGQFEKAAQQRPKWTVDVGMALGNGILGGIKGSVSQHVVDLMTKGTVGKGWETTSSAIKDFNASLKNADLLLDSNTNSLKGNTAGAESNRKGLLTLAGQAYAGAEAFKNATGVNTNFTASMALSIPKILDAAQATGISRAAAADFLNTVIKIPGYKITTVGLVGDGTAEAAALKFLSTLNDIPAVKTTVLQIVSDYSGNNPSGAQSFGTDYAALLGAHRKADGGIHPTGVKGGLYQWAEAGGEAFIPLARSKRPRALELWAQTGKMLGVTAMANGGHTRPMIASGGLVYGRGDIHNHLTVYALDAPSFKDFLARGGDTVVMEAITRKTKRGGTTLTR